MRGHVNTNYVIPAPPARGRWALGVLFVCATAAVALISYYMGNWPWKFQWVDGGKPDTLLLSVIVEASMDLSGIGLVGVCALALVLMHKRTGFHQSDLPAFEAQHLDSDSDQLRQFLRAHVVEQGLDIYLSVDDWLDSISHEYEYRPNQGYVLRTPDERVNPDETLLDGVISTQWAVSHQVINGSTVEAIIGLQRPGEEDFLQQVLTVYFETSPGLIQQIQAAQKVSDWTKLIASAHRLRSNSAYLGAERLTALCEQLERLVAAKDDEHCREVCEQLPVEYGEASAHLVGYLHYQSKAA